MALLTTIHGGYAVCNGQLPILRAKAGRLTEELFTGYRDIHFRETSAEFTYFSLIPPLNGSPIAASASPLASNLRVRAYGILRMLTVMALRQQFSVTNFGIKAELIASDSKKQERSSKD